MQFVLNIFSYTLKESPNLNQRRKIAGFLIGHGNFYADRIPHEPFPAIKKIPVYLKMGETQGKVWFPKKGVTGNEEDFVADLESETRKNTDFRRVLYTGKFSQLVLMSLKPGEEIGMETHDDVDQFFRFEEGNGEVVIDGVKNPVNDGSGVIVPSGAKHNVVNTSKTAAIKLYAIYSPPEHEDKVIIGTRPEALAKKEHFTGKTTE